ncbi:MAG: SOS response-associated peptidase [Alphaproteobacteria bacterium]|nr:SOS response-associated peptidase [Alphaproteobacteria bacterium]MBT8474867.1 SOS response-associated peptidase [Alphaproteobacteria bacterium]
MPGRLFLTTPVDDLAAMLGGDASGVVGEPPRRNIAPGQAIVTCRRDRTLAHMRWGIIPVGRVNARGRPVMETLINARSETVFSKSAYEGVTRCIVPADGWYEWTGKARRKTAWRISARDARPLWFAAICDAWTAPNGQELWQVATVTCPPNGDVRDIHDRMGVLLDIADTGTWLEGDEADAVALMRPAPDGSLSVEEAADVDWTAP